MNTYVLGGNLVMGMISKGNGQALLLVFLVLLGISITGYGIVKTVKGVKNNDKKLIVVGPILFSAGQLVISIGFKHYGRADVVSNAFLTYALVGGPMIWWIVNMILAEVKRFSKANIKQHLLGVKQIALFCGMMTWIIIVSSLVFSI